MSVTEDQIISKFREMVTNRYDFDTLKNRMDVPDSITESIISDIRTYFLESIYPPPAERRALEASFESLGNYVKSPRKIWGLLGNMTKAVFKFGRQFPAALKAGLAGLDAFVGAKEFEHKMATKGSQANISAPISDEDFERTMSNLPKKEVESFIKDVKSLFKIMTNIELTSKTLEILDNVVETMRKKSNIYPADEVDGILLGRGILEKGIALFSQYDENTRSLMVDLIYKNEMLYQEEVYKKFN